MIGVLEPQFRVAERQGKVLKADSAAKSLIPERKAVVESVEGKVEGEGEVEA